MLSSSKLLLIAVADIFRVQPTQNPGFPREASIWSELLTARDDHLLYNVKMMQDARDVKPCMLVSKCVLTFDARRADDCLSDRHFVVSIAWRCL